MRKELKFSVITGSMGKLGDRYCLEGYKEDNTFEEKLENLSKISLLTGLELCYNIDGDESDPEEVKTLMRKYNYQAPVVNAPLSNSRKWKFGSFTAKSPEIRKEAIAITKKTINFAEAVGANAINVWLGMDGFDYSFQVDYAKQWDYIVECIRECADYKPSIQLLLEPKQREPRNRCFIDAGATAVLLAKEIDRKNIGVTIDIGHVIQSGQNISQVLEMCNRFKLLTNVHVNDNYGTWDDDMILGSVHFIEFLEMFFTLRKINYEGWLSVDIFPFRENSFTATKESILYMQKLNELVDTIGYDVLAKALESKDAAEIFGVIREKCFK